MARTREFDRDVALRAAMETFWEKGFDAASLQDLTDRMGISRSSLYEAFGDKKTLYLEALERYGDTCGQVARDELLGEGSGLESLKKFFAAAIDCAISTRGKGGCFQVNAAIAAPTICAEAKTRLRAGLRDLECELESVLLRAQAAGEIRADLDTGALARMFVGLDYGLNAVARIHPDRAFLEDMVRGAFGSL